MTGEQSKKVFNALRAKILGGEYSSRFPSERALMRQFGVTRSAIRTILAKLESQHVITRHRGSGTFLTDGQGSDNTGRGDIVGTFPPFDLRRGVVKMCETLINCAVKMSKKQMFAIV